MGPSGVGALLSFMSRAAFLVAATIAPGFLNLYPRGIFGGGNYSARLSKPLGAKLANLSTSRAVH